MPSKAVQKIYTEINEIAEEFGKLDLPSKCLEDIDNSLLVAKMNFFEQGELLTKNFTKFISESSPNLKERMDKLYEDYTSLGRPKIFFTLGGSKEDMFRYNPYRINPINLFFVIIFSNYNMSDFNLFEDAKDFRAYLISYLLFHQRLGGLLKYLKSDEHSNLLPTSFSELLVDCVIGNLM